MSDIDGYNGQKKDEPSGPRHADRSSDGIFATLFGFGTQDDLQGRSVRQYILSLRSLFDSITSERSDLPPKIVEGVKSILSRYEGDGVDWNYYGVWDDAYLCERLMVQLFDQTMLDVELQRRITEAQELGLPISEFYRGRVQTPADGHILLEAEQVAVNRSLLSRLTLDLQWHYNMRDVKRRYAHLAQKRVSWTFLMSLLVFSSVMYLTFDFGGTEGSQNLSATQPSSDE